MSYAEDGYLAVGGVEFPLEETNSILQDADPAIFFLLDYYAKCIKQHIGSRWNAVMTELGRVDLLNKSVISQFSYDPLPYLSEIQAQLPFIALFRTSEVYSETSIVHYIITSKVTLQYTMPPFTAAQMSKVSPFLSAISKVIVGKTDQSNDPNVNSGADPFQLAGLQEVTVDNAKYGALAADSNQYMPTLLMELTVKERRNMHSSNVVPLTGVDNTFDECQ